METRAQEHRHKRLIRDLDAVELLLTQRSGATKRLQRELGAPTADGLVASLMPSLGPVRRRHLH